MKARKGIYIKCQACENEFYVPNYRKMSAKFCSLQCQNHNQYDKWIFNCEGCGKRCESSPSRKNYRKKFCSIECREYKRKNEKQKRDHIRAINNISRGTSQGRTIRRNIFLIKEKKCQECGYHEHDFCLDLHHIDENCRNNNMDNIAILCVICHRKLHKGFLTLKVSNMAAKKSFMGEREPEAHENKKGAKKEMPKKEMKKEMPKKKK